MLLQTQNQQPIEFTQSDSAVLLFSATDDLGNVVNLTGATFSTQILGANGVGPITFPDGQHTITDAALGQFSLTLATTDTTNCGLGCHKAIICQITMGGVVQTYRGVNLLTVYPPVPLQ